MPATPHTSPALAPPAPGFAHATTAPTGRIVHISGQPGTDEQGNVVPGGFAAQMERAVRNLGRALEAAGARPEHLVKTTIFVVGWEPSMLEALGQGAAAAREHVPFPETAVTLIGVQSLFTPDMLVEIEAVAVTPG
jgi:enamine deaminase RidA (YjgF/YER057c/UK114 family)